ncbi:MAG: N-acetylglucosamine kinase [Gaiellaceae bacterium]
MKTSFAVDGGGSKTDAALVREDGAVLGFARGPLSHPHHVGVAASADVIDALAGKMGASPADLAVLLLAGLDFPDEEDAYRAEAARRGWAVETVVGNDTYAVLRAGTERGWGVAVTCGAGINCVGVAPDGREARFPSLGAVSGDWGGAGDVGLAAAWAAARSEDGRGPRTVLERLVPEHFDLATPVELARAITAGRVASARLGELAPVVFGAAERDAVAGEIVDRLAGEVVALVRAAAARLELAEAEVDVVLGGGLLQSGNRRLLAEIEAGLRQVAPGLSLHVARSRPIVGAALTALDLLGAPPEAYARAREELDRSTTSVGDVAGDAAAVGELT